MPFHPGKLSCLGEGNRLGLKRPTILSTSLPHFSSRIYASLTLTLKNWLTVGAGSLGVFVGLASRVEIKEFQVRAFVGKAKAKLGCRCFSQTDFISF